MSGRVLHRASNAARSIAHSPTFQATGLTRTKPPGPFPVCPFRGFFPLHTGWAQGPDPACVRSGRILFPVTEKCAGFPSAAPSAAGCDRWLESKVSMQGPVGRGAGWGTWVEGLAGAWLSWDVVPSPQIPSDCGLLPERQPSLV